MKSGKQKHNYQIKSKTSRNALEPRREPYWDKLAVGFFIGFRVIKPGVGTWIARLDKLNKEQSLRKFDDNFDKEKYDDAVKVAYRWRESLEKGLVSVGFTVNDACMHYLENLKSTRSKNTYKDAKGRFDRLVFNSPIGKIQLSNLQPINVRKWVNDQLRVEDDYEDEEGLENVRRSKDSANRNLATFKAALNFARNDRLVTSADGWNTIKPFTGVGKSREHYLSVSERQELLKNLPESLLHLAKAAIFTGARIGELANCRVKDFDVQNRMLYLNGKAGERTIPISTEAYNLFRNQTLEKPRDEFVFTQLSGKQWNKDAWKRPFKSAVNDSGLPKDIVFYHLRHAAISDFVMFSGLSNGAIALIVGTSTAMIDKHYGHLQPDKTRESLDKAYQMANTKLNS